MDSIDHGALQVNVPSMITDLPNLDYHRLRGLSVSGLKDFARSPMHYRFLRDNPKPSTPAMQIGTALHALVLEPDRASDVIAVAPDCDRRTKTGKEIWAEFELMHSGKIVMKLDDWNNINDMRDAVYALPEAKRLLSSGGMTELSVFWEDHRGTLCKCRPDRLTEHGIVIDLKSCQDASPDGFARACAQFRYHWQAAWYLAGLTAATGYKHTEFLLIAVEKDPPHGVGVYKMPQVYTDIAMEQMEPLTEEYARCIKSGTWPGYSNRIETIQMPVWALKEVTQ